MSTTYYDIKTNSVSQLRPVESTLQRISVANFVFQLALVLFCVARCINLSELSYINLLSISSQIISYFAIGLLAFKIFLFARYTVMEVTICLIFIAIAVLGAFNYGSTELIYLVLFIIGAKDVNAHSICKTALSTIIICGTLIILLSLMGLLENRTTYEDNGLLGNTVTRQALGFTHVNQVGQLSLIVFLCYLFLRYKSFGVLDICLTLIWAGILFFVVTSKTAPILMVFSCILIILSKNMPYKWFIGICIIISIIGVMVSILLAYFYDPTNEFMAQLNTWTSGRLNYAHRTFENYSITLLGQSIEFGEVGTSGRIILDNAYVRLLFCYGVISLIAIVIVYISAFIKAYKEKMLSMIIIISVMFLVGFAETWYFTMPGVIILSIAFGKGNKNNDIANITLNDENNIINEDILNTNHRNSN